MVSPPKYLTLVDILPLFEKHWGIKLKRQSLYFYIKKHGFPRNTGRGAPRVWEKKKVDQFFANNK